MSVVLGTQMITAGGLVFGVVLVVGVAAAVTITGLRAGRRARDVLLDLVSDKLRAVIAPAQIVDLRCLEGRLINVVLGSVVISVTGERKLPSTVTLGVSPGDLVRLQAGTDGGLREVCADVRTVVVRKAGPKGVLVPDDFTVRVVADPMPLDGRPIRLTVGGARQAVPLHRSARPHRGGATAQPHSEVPAVVVRDDPPPTPQRTAEVDQRPTEPLSGPPTKRARRSTVVTRKFGRPELVPVGGGAPLRLGHGRSTLGRAGADLLVEHPEVSSIHAEIKRDGSRWMITDSSSLNGTFLNGQRVTSAYLQSGDIIRLASSGPELVFSHPEAAGEL
jgi:hypothetical protein